LQIFARTLAHFSFSDMIFVAIVADFHDVFSNFHRCSRKCRITLQFPENFRIFREKSEFSGHENAEKVICDSHTERLVVTPFGQIV